GGMWTYTLNNVNDTAPAVNGMRRQIGRVLFRTEDGTAQTVTITINGSNDAAVISGTSAGSVVEAGGVSNGTLGTPAASGTLTDSAEERPPRTVQAVLAVAASKDGTWPYGRHSGA